MTAPAVKPLNRKAYGSIGHLPESRMGPGDHHVHEGQALICTTKVRDKHDRVIVQEKLDGSCVAVALLDGTLHPIGRAGWPAISSKYEMHQLFAAWVWKHEDRFRAVLREGERICGEWLAQAHSTIYDLTDREPFAPFDLMTGDKRAPFAEAAQNPVSDTPLFDSVPATPGKDGHEDSHHARTVELIELMAVPAIPHAV